MENEIEIYVQLSCAYSLSFLGGRWVGDQGGGVATSLIDTHHAPIFTPYNTSCPQWLLNVSCNFNSVYLG